MPALAEVPDLEARMGREFNETETVQAAALLDDVSAYARDLTGVDWLDPDNPTELDPDRSPSLVGIVCSAVRRSMENPDGLKSESIDTAGYTASYGDADTGLYFTKAERRALRRAAGLSGISSITLEGAYGINGYPVVDEGWA